MANLDVKTAEKAEMEDAIKAGDTSKFVDSVEAKIAKDCEDWALKLRNELNGSEDEHILAERGVHVLTSAEKKYYEAFKKRLTNPQAALTDYEVTIPEPITSRI